MSKISSLRDKRRQSLFPAISNPPNSRRLAPEVWSDTTKETVNKKEYLTPDVAGESGLWREATFTPSQFLPEAWELPIYQTSPEAVRATIRRNLGLIVSPKRQRTSIVNSSL